ncbi:ATP synthase F1 subcomplex delta subunit [Pelagimonas varians]|uniref:ATP synthase subunit delta n=1 Tax=Pelagimonas varians TaxID=696760 RepID=A0A238L1K4_9RHOB|nr:ATP synthase F1 subcomplex delta subunit [Pelagimonas varians]SMX48867.1 ATP synthase subunit delta [Pelagimonas varians]
MRRIPAASRGLNIERVDVSESASISSGIAVRYATAIFEIVKETNDLPKLEANLNELSAALDNSADLRDLISSPVYSREAQGQAVAAIANQMGLIPAVTNALGLMSEKRRLFVLPHLIAKLRDMLADEKGEVTADVASATALSDAQASKLAETLSASVGKDVKIKATVDESLIGGLVVKVGSKMIDTSIRSKLNSLQNAMKEVG